MSNISELRIDIFFLNATTFTINKIFGLCRDGELKTYSYPDLNYNLKTGDFNLKLYAEKTLRKSGFNCGYKITLSVSYFMMN